MGQLMFQNDHHYKQAINSSQAIFEPCPQAAWSNCIMPAMSTDFQEELRRYGPNAVAVCQDLAQARRYCARLAKSHYENFTVASALLPRRLLRHFHAVYAYCRWADDLADEVG